MNECECGEIQWEKAWGDLWQCRSCGRIRTIDEIRRRTGPGPVIDRVRRNIQAKMSQAPDVWPNLL